MTTSRLLAGVGAATALALSVTLVVSTSPASADAPLAPRSSFTMIVNPADGTVAAPADGEAIPNVDSVKSTIRAYYNATGGKADKNSSRYIEQVKSIERRVLDSLPASAAPGAALVFDVDDTLLWNYDFEDFATNFNFDPTINGQYVASHAFPAVPGMPQMLATLKARGYRLYGITGRPAAQENDTIANLTEQGFTTTGAPAGTPLFDADNLYTKSPVAVTAGTAAIADQPWVDCTADGIAGSCSTVEYKAFTRQHIETADDVDLVLNVGDQWSDLAGGFADRTRKIPNPTYFLASPDIAGAPASDALMAPPSSYSMQPDGSSGTTVPSGDDIPNIDPVRKMIRAYYNAPAGVADKTTSPYITQLTSLTTAWADQVSNDCTARAQARAAAAANKNAAARAVVAQSRVVAANIAKVAAATKRVKAAKTAKAKAAARKRLAAAKAALASSRSSFAAKQQAYTAITLPVPPAVVFDADDTTLWNYDLEDSVLKFVYNPATAATWVDGQLFPAVPGMLSVVRSAAGAGCAVFGLTGRPASQQAATVANLEKVGYVDTAGKPLFTAARFFTKDVANQPWVDCGPDRVCSTIEYKSGTRAHIQDGGFRIVANVGDQYSDLIGGNADHVYKVPNPTYYLP